MSKFLKRQETEPKKVTPKKEPKKVEPKKDDEDCVEIVDEETKKKILENLQFIPEEGCDGGQPIQMMNPMAMPDIFNNIRNNHYIANKMMFITDEISWPIITEMIKRLYFYVDGNKETPIRIYIGSPGGLCDAGNAFIDIMDKIIAKGYTIETICMGSCSSMAAVILAAGSKGHRYAFPNARIMIHSASSGTYGGNMEEFQTVADELAFWTDVSAKQLSKYTGKKKSEVLEALKKDNFMSATEAKKFGIVDKIDVCIPNNK